MPFMRTSRDPRVELRCRCSVLSETSLTRLGPSSALPVCRERELLLGQEKLPDSCRLTLAPSSQLLSTGPDSKEDTLNKRGEQLWGLAGCLRGRAWGAGVLCPLPSTEQAQEPWAADPFVKSKSK